MSRQGERRGTAHILDRFRDRCARGYRIYLCRVCVYLGMRIVRLRARVCDQLITNCFRRYRYDRTRGRSDRMAVSRVVCVTTDVTCRVSTVWLDRVVSRAL